MCMCILTAFMYVYHISVMEARKRHGISQTWSCRMLQLPYGCWEQKTHIFQKSSQCSSTRVSSPASMISTVAASTCTPTGSTQGTSFCIPSGYVTAAHIFSLQFCWHLGREAFLWQRQLTVVLVEQLDGAGSRRVTTALQISSSLG